MSRSILIVGLVLLLICTIASLMLVQQHLGGLSLPGCGPGSPCAEAAESVWGKLPYVDWPVSYIGLAYFLGVLVAWPTMRRGVTPAVRWIVRLGVLASLGFVVVMIAGGYICKYCLAVHIANVAFWILMEVFARQPQPTWRPAVVLGIVFLTATVGLGIAELAGRRSAVATAEAQLAQSSAKILAAASQPVETPASKPAAVATTSPTSAPAVAQTNPSSSAPSTAATKGCFTGRYRLGPEAAVVRFVVFIDYQCKQCHLLEAALKRIFDERHDMSISVKQFPGGKDCNPYTEEEHANACAAARAAEAAGLLHGNDGFWQMHFWLFDHSGRFTDAELRETVKGFGYDVDEFERVMWGETTGQSIQADIQEGFDLALSYTPLVFLNGVEFAGWNAPQALVRVLQQIDQRKLPAKTCADDHPLPAADHYILEWRNQRVHDLPPAHPSWDRGPASTPFTIVMWGDYTQPNTALADNIISQFMTEHPNVRYTFRHYPFDPACNPAAKEKRSPMTCRAAQAAEAAGRLGGQAGFWKMHDWLLANQKDLSEETLRVAAATLGFDPPAFFAMMDSSEVADAIKADGQLAEKCGLRNTPLIYLRGRIVPRWMHGPDSLLRPILDAAAKE